MSHRESNFQSEPNAKRQKTNSTLSRRIDDCIPNMLVMPSAEHTSIEESSLPPFSVFNDIPISSEHNDTTHSTCASTSFDKNVDSTIEKSSNVYAEDFKENNSTKSASTEQRPMKESDLHGAEAAAAISEPKPSEKLPVELLTATFDYLSLKGLCAVRQTCTRWREIAGYCFQHNYLFSPVWIRQHKGKYVLIVDSSLPGAPINRDQFGIHGFIQFIRNISIDGLDDFNYFLDKTSNFQQLKEIKLVSIDLTTTSIDGMKETFNKVEYLLLIRCKTDEHFIDHIFTLSPNLKRLSVIRSETGTEWLRRKHPTLERFAFMTKKIVPIATFLENNPNIRMFEINKIGLWENRHSIRTAKIRLDALAIFLNDYILEAGILKSTCLLLNELLELEIYKRLNVYAKNSFDPQDLDEMASLRTFDKLYADFHCIDVFMSYELNNFPSLQEFHLPCSLYIKDTEAVARSLVNLERIHVDYAYFAHIVPFIKHSTKLREIIIECCDIEKYSEDDLFEIPSFERTKNEAFSEGQPTIIYLSVLNRERAKLPNAEKITLYVDETVYLATKWARQETDLKFISLKRRESFEWDDDYIRYF